MAPICLKAQVARRGTGVRQASVNPEEGFTTLCWINVSCIDVIILLYIVTENNRILLNYYCCCHRSLIQGTRWLFCLGGESLVWFEYLNWSPAVILRKGMVTPMGEWQSERSPLPWSYKVWLSASSWPFQRSSGPDVGNRSPVPSRDRHQIS